MYLTVQETSKMLKVSDKTVRNWIKHLGLPAKKVGGQFRIKEQDLQQFIEYGGRKVAEGAKCVNNIGPNEVLVYGILRNHSDGLFRDEIIKEMTYEGQCKLSHATLTTTLKSLEDNVLVTVKTIERKKFYKAKEVSASTNFPYVISYPAIYATIKSNLSTEELRLYSYMKYLQYKENTQGGLLEIKQEELAEYLVVTQSRISQMIQNLLDKNLLSVYGGRDSYVYKLNY